MTRITDAVRTANRIMRKYDERDPERIAHYAGIMILPQPFVKQKGAYTVMMRKPINFYQARPASCGALHCACARAWASFPAQTGGDAKRRLP